MNYLRNNMLVHSVSVKTNHFSQQKVSEWEYGMIA